LIPKFGRPLAQAESENRLGTILVEKDFKMKSSDVLPMPLDQRPKVKLTELGRRDGGLGWETITYQGEDGNRYEVSVNKDGVERNVLIPPMEADD
jgi:hypothetical protein